MSDLSRRLKQLRGRQSAKRPPQSVSRRPLGEGWQLVAAGVWERTLPMPKILPESFDSPFVLPSPMRSENLLFYDLETTGLGGSGNTAFLIGFGRQSGQSFCVTQLFMDDYPAEPAMLDRYSKITDPDLMRVSFNGRSFDSQVLKSRFLLNRLPPPLPPETDLLYPSRRMWQAVLPDVRLGTLEQHVLGTGRTDDLPGSEAPDAWFEWLKERPQRIEGVFRHNADDIVSLARLLLRIEEWGAVNPEEPRSFPNGERPAFRGMARQWSARSPKNERRWLECGWSAGETLCGRTLALRCRRAGDYESMVRICGALNRSGRNHFAAVELAKYYEHRAGDPQAALNVLDPLDALPLKNRFRQELEHRRKRLIRKCLAVPPWL